MFGRSSRTVSMVTRPLAYFGNNASTDPIVSSPSDNKTIRVALFFLPQQPPYQPHLAMFVSSAVSNLSTAGTVTSASVNCIPSETFPQMSTALLIDSLGGLLNFLLATYPPYLLHLQSIRNDPRQTKSAPLSTLNVTYGIASANTSRTIVMHRNTNRIVLFPMKRMPDDFHV